MRIFAWADSPLAPTGFGRSSRHVLFALHEAGHEITQLAVNADTSTLQQIPWKTFVPMDRAGDPYGLRDLDQILAGGRFDALWSTFDPEIPWFMQIDGGQPPIAKLQALRMSNPGFKMAGWFPVDGGPLSDNELAVLGLAPVFDAPVTMSPHVYDLVDWTVRLRGRQLDLEAYKQRLRMIPHGVDTSTLRIPSVAERALAKVAKGWSADTFVVLQVERNQMRKQNYLALEVMERLFQRQPLLRGKVVLYQHMTPDEDNHGCRVGFNLPELAWRYGLQPGRDVFWTPGFVAEEAMQGVYDCADMFLSVSTGEGFQYPAWEALACGVPIVVPNDSSRRAYFKTAPNAHLYETNYQRLVVRGGYNRRMNFADPVAAAAVIRKMFEGRAKYAPKREAGRAWVERTAGVADVKAAWVKLYAELEENLNTERRAAKLAPLKGAFEGMIVGWSQRASAGDVLLSAPALRVLREQHPVRVHIPREMLEVAHVGDGGTEFSTEPLPEGAIDFSKLVDLEAWTKSPRVEVFAQALGVKVEQPYRTAAPEGAADLAKSQFLEQFGVALGDTIGLGFETDTPHRSLPPNYYDSLVAAVRVAGYTPVILGKTKLNYRKVGVADMTGATDLITAMTVVGQMRAFVGADSGLLHAALAQGVPSVGVFTIIDPNHRLTYYDAKWLAVVPNDPKFPIGENPAWERANWAPYPAVGEWAAKVDVNLIAKALRDLLEATA